MEELLAGISSRELSEWMAFASVEPFGEERADVRAALVASMVANTARDRKKRRTPFKVTDFLLEWDWGRAGPERQPWEQMLRTVEMWNAALGGRDLRKKDGDNRESGGQADD